MGYGLWGSSTSLGLDQSIEGPTNKECIQVSHQSKSQLDRAGPKIEPERRMDEDSSGIGVA